MHTNLPPPNTPLLIVLAGPTAVGKTGVALQLAQEFGTEIISSDSRQFYREMKIGTAIPSPEELSVVTHHFIGHLSIHDRYDVSRFETEALARLEQLFLEHKLVIMTGGSGLYINAVCKGFDELPDRDRGLRKKLQALFDNEGIAALQDKLKKLDPLYFEKVDKNNPNRLLRAIEVCEATGKPYSQLRKGQVKERPFRILKIALNRDREELFERIAARTNQMMAEGLLDEVKSLLPYRHENALNTVGYKELFEHLDGNISLEEAITNIKTNTRRYAKRQLTWFKKDHEYHWFHPERIAEIATLIATENS
ncbi:MAG: tRNA (adenosine(37)-N6)-dimethylallyltransferase MiaA [Bacteroidales bacterium]|nr:tRNA (adenosine(37)-N6)-dimethylallyltransferase MiaA [Bacteroidales bacterium]